MEEKMEKEDSTRTKLRKVSEGRGNFPYIFKAESIKEFLQRRPEDPNNQQSGEGSLSLAQWEAQWQEFLRIMENPHNEWEIPRFPEKPSPWKDAKAFLASFEQVAAACQWPKEELVIRLLPALSGEAEKAFNSLDVGDREDYGKVKAAILQREALSWEKQRQQFRFFSYDKAEGPRGAYTRLQEMCHRWLRVENHSKEQILELLILEQLLAVLPPKIQRWVRECVPESCSQAVALAEEFLLRQQATAGIISESGWVPSEGKQRKPLMNMKEEESGEASPLAGDIKVTGGGFQGFSLEKVKNEEAEENFQDPGGTEEQEGSHPEKSRDNPIPCQGEGLCKIPIKEESTNNRENKGLSVQKRIYSREDEDESVAFGKSSVQSSNIISQEQVPSQDKPYRCLECGKSFSRRMALASHQRIHLGEDQENEDDEELLGLSTDEASCEEWKGNYANRGKPKRQKGSRVTEERDKPITCQGGGFREVIYTVEEAYKCLACGKGFSDQSQYNTHLRKHSRKKTHKCWVCGKCFRCRSELLGHHRVHTGEKPYSCSVCGKGFPHKTNLSQHQKLHSQEKPYSCSECGKRFPRSFSLQQHQRIHTGEKPFECPVCGKGFSWKSHLQRHQITHINYLANQSIARAGLIFQAQNITSGSAQE